MGGGGLKLSGCVGTFFESGGETEVYLTRQEAWRHYISYISVVRVSGWTFIVHGVYTNPGRKSLASLDVCVGLALIRRARRENLRA